MGQQATYYVRYMLIQTNGIYDKKVPQRNISPPIFTPWFGHQQKPPPQSYSQWSVGRCCCNRHLFLFIQAILFPPSTVWSPPRELSKLYLLQASILVVAVREKKTPGKSGVSKVSSVPAVFFRPGQAFHTKKKQKKKWLDSTQCTHVPPPCRENVLRL